MRVGGAGERGGGGRESNTLSCPSHLGGGGGTYSLSFHAGYPLID